MDILVFSLIAFVFGVMAGFVLAKWIEHRKSQLQSQQEAKPVVDCDPDSTQGPVMRID